MQEQLARQQELLQVTQSLARVGSFQWTVASGEVTWSDQLYEIFGVDPKSFTPSFENYLSRVHPDDVEQVQQRINAAMEGCGSFEIQERIRWDDGSERVLLSRGTVICGSNGQPERIIGACLDVTDQTRALEQLHASEARYRALVDHASDSLVLHDDQGIIIDVNSTACQSLGYTREELIGKTPQLYNHQMSADDLRKLAEQLRQFESATFEANHTDRDGRVFPVEVRLRAFSENGQARAVSLVLDISERRRAEADRAASERALSESNEKYRIVTESLPQLIWMMRSDFTVEYVSPSALAYVGGNPTELTTGWRKIVHPDDLSLVIDKLTQSRLTEQATEAEIRTLRHDGHYRWMLARSIPLSNADGAPRKWLGAAIDIHDRKLAEQAREASENRLQLLLNSASLVVWEADPVTLDFTYVSDFCDKLLGYSRQAWMEPNFWINHLHPDDADQAIAVCRAACEIGSDHRMEYRMLAADGRSVWIEDAIHVQSSDGRVRSIRGVMQDISDRKLLEDQLRQSQKMEAIGRLAGGVAHDFNNILTVMMGYSELLLFTLPANDSSRSAIGAINEAGKRAAALTRQLLTFSRKALVAPKVLDLNELVRSTENLLRPTIGEDIRLSIEIDPTVRPIKADRVHIEQVLMNLAINARDAMPQGGTMIISTHNKVRVPCASGLTAENYVELALKDNGCGISPDTLGKIFDPFFTTKEVGRGTGLGLSVVHGVVTGAGGFIHVDSVIGQGTTFHLCFPATTASSPSSLVPPSADYSRGAETVLLVEDDQAVRAVTLTTLTQQGYRVIDADSGEQALFEFRRAPASFDVVLTDVVMPGMSGRILAESIRQIRPDIPILYMSGHTDDAMIQHGISSSGDAFIQKPFHPQALGQKLRELITRA